MLSYQQTVKSANKSCRIGRCKMIHWFVHFSTKDWCMQRSLPRMVFIPSFAFLSSISVSICPHISGLKETPSKWASRTLSIAVKPQQYCYYVYYYCCCYYCCCYYYQDSRVFVLVLFCIYYYYYYACVCRFIHLKVRRTPPMWKRMFGAWNTEYIRPVIAVMFDWPLKSISPSAFIVGSNKEGRHSSRVCYVVSL